MDEDGPIDRLFMHCLKPHVGNGIRLQDTPAHLPDEGYLCLSDIIVGPLKVVPVGLQFIDVPEYNAFRRHFDVVSTMDRANLI